MSNELRLDSSQTSLPDDFNWMAILKDLAQGAPLSDHDHERLVVMAGGWETCACGQLCKPLLCSGNGMPLDKDLIMMGGLFVYRVSSRNWDMAIALFHRIEARTAKLLEDQEGMGVCVG